MARRDTKRQTAKQIQDDNISQLHQNVWANIVWPAKTLVHTNIRHKCILQMFQR